MIIESQKRIKRSQGDDLIYLEMTLVADKYTIAFHGDKTAKFLLMLANLVSYNPKELRIKTPSHILNSLDYTTFMFMGRL